MNARLTQSSVPISNLGLIGRIIRFFIGAIMYAVGWYMIVVWGYVFYGVVASLASAYPIMTAMLGWDPLYQIAGFSGMPHIKHGRTTK